MTNLNDVLLAMSNIPVVDPIAEIWGRGLQGGGYTIIEYTGALPITINANGEPLIDYRIYGNTEQNGTPTPENPIMPIGCGERTENLFDINDLWDKGTNISVFKYYEVRVPNGTYTVGTDVIDNSNKNVASVLIDKSVLSTITSASNGVFINRPRTITVTSGMVVVYIRIESTQYLTWTRETFAPYHITLTEGLTAPESYIPYGYKLPILSNSTVTNIYLGEAQTTRRIKKLVLTGNEVINKSSSSATNYLFYTPRRTLTGSIPKTSIVCDRLQAVVNPPVAQIGINTNNNYNYGVVYFNFGAAIMNAQPSGNTIDGLKEYLAAQYAAGTPVTVWYVLAEPETGIVNEPLMKIGNYADTVSMEQTGVNIPTNNGSTVIDYDGTTKPSQLYIKYLGR